MTIPLPATAAEMASLIDHTLLRADASQAEVRRYCVQAAEHGFASVCVNPVHVALVARELSAARSVACSVVGFPLGATTPEDKAAEAARALTNGAAEIDMVIDVGALKEGRQAAVATDVAAVRAATRGAVLKVIIETCLLDDDQKRAACRIAAEAGADFVKTSTGFSTGGATVADVALMRAAVGPTLGVKASGGIRSFEQAKAMIEAGATRIGASSGVALISGAAAADGKGY